MFHLKSLVFLCCFGSLPCQTFFHTNLGGGGSYASISHGAQTHQAGHHGAQRHQAGHTVHTPHHQQVYKVSPVKPANQQVYQKPAYQQSSYKQPAYQQPAYQKPAYQQPAYQKPVYQQPAYQKPAYQQPSHPSPAVKSPYPSYGEKCSLDYEEKYVQVCLPVLETDCKHDKLKNGVRVREEYDCYSVTRTVCVEDEEIELTEVCAVAYSLQEVAAVAKILDVKWAKQCTEEVVCANPHSKGAYHAADYCKEQIKSVCTLYPELYPVEKKIVMKLPQPYDTCITKEIILPRIRCQQVKEKKCAAVPRTESADDIETDKCTVSIASPRCEDTHVKLPKQACLETFRKTKVVYKEDDNKGNYSVRY